VLQLQGELLAVEDAARKSSEADMDGQALVRRCLVSQVLLAPRPSALPPATRRPLCRLPRQCCLHYHTVLTLGSRRYVITLCCLDHTVLP